MSPRHGAQIKSAIAPAGALILTTTVALLALPALSNRSRQAARPEGSDLQPMIGGTWWSISRLALTVMVLSSIAFAPAGYATPASHLHAAISATCALIAIALLLHQLVLDLLEAAAAPDTPPGAWVRCRFGLPPDTTIRGQHLVLLLFDAALVLRLAIAIPAAWNVDIDAILDGFDSFCAA